MKRKSPNKAVFLDRDGTIAYDVRYCRRPENFQLIPHVAEAIALVNKAGLKVVLVTNQSGVARGYFTQQVLDEIHAKLKHELAVVGARLDGIYVCAHHPDDGCLCRKPGTALFRQAAEELHISLKDSYMVGDQGIDIEAGKAAGCTTVLVETGLAVPDGDGVNPDHRAPDLYQAALWILRTKENFPIQKVY